LKAGARLQAVCDTWDSNKSDLDGALLFNRKLWTVFLSSVMSSESPLPAEIRQNVANLGAFILAQTMALSTNPRIEVVASLININRELAAGLRGRG
jgi:flagellar protein FlaF